MTPSLVLHLHTMLFHNRVKFDAHRPLTVPLVAAIVLGLTSVLGPAPTLTRAGNSPSGASVNLINALNDSVVVHCWSRESDMGSVTLYPGVNYYWSFHPNIFGRTVFKCNFLWRQDVQEFAVWKGSYHPDRPPCCAKGPCSYRICPEGFYNALMVDTEDYGPAESWEFCEPWMPNP